MFLRPSAVCFVSMVAVVLGGQAQTAPDAKRPVLAIEQVSVVDVVRGEIGAPVTVLLVDGRIAALDQPERVLLPPETVRIDGRGRFLIPGLVDLHVHLFNNSSRRPPNDWAFPLFVAHGVTGVREMRTEPAAMGQVREWRDQLQRGTLVAPRLLALGAAVRPEPEEGTRLQVRAARAAGIDFLKMFSSVREPQWRVVLDEARALGLPVYGHVPAEVTVLEAAFAGQRSNEHLTQIYEACTAQEKELLAARRGLEGAARGRLIEGQEVGLLAAFDPQLGAQVAAALAQTGQVQVPTLVLAHFEARGGSREKAQDDPRWQTLRPDERERWERIFRTFPLGSEAVKLAERRREVSLHIVRLLHSAGVRILAGTDTPMPLVYPGSALHQELELLVEAGLSPADALRAATLWPAEFLGLEKSSGSVAGGKIADLVLLEANPLEDIRHTQRIQGVILAGRWLPRAELDALLAKPWK